MAGEGQRGSLVTSLAAPDDAEWAALVEAGHDLGGRDVDPVLRRRPEPRWQASWSSTSSSLTRGASSSQAMTGTMPTRCSGIWRWTSRGWSSCSTWSPAGVRPVRRHGDVLGRSHGQPTDRPEQRLEPLRRPDGRHDADRRTEADDLQHRRRDVVHRRDHHRLRRLELDHAGRIGRRCDRPAGRRGRRVPGHPHGDRRVPLDGRCTSTRAPVRRPSSCRRTAKGVMRSLPCLGRPARSAGLARHPVDRRRPGRRDRRRRFPDLSDLPTVGPVRASRTARTFLRRASRSTSAATRWPRLTRTPRCRRSRRSEQPVGGVDPSSPWPAPAPSQERPAPPESERRAGTVLVLLAVPVLAVSAALRGDGHPRRVRAPVRGRQLRGPPRRAPAAVRPHARRPARQPRHPRLRAHRARARRDVASRRRCRRCGCRMGGARGPRGARRVDRRRGRPARQVADELTVDGGTGNRLVSGGCGGAWTAR